MNTRRICLTLRVLYEIFTRQHIPTASAGFSYFLTLTFFPLLICLHAMLGSLFPGNGELLALLRGLLPEDTISTILEYLSYVAAHHSPAMLVGALTVMATSSSAAFRTVARVMGEMRGASRFTGPASYVFSFCFSLLFLVAIYVSVLLIVTGKWFLEFADRHIMSVNITEGWWIWRFALLFLVLFVMLSAVYRITAPKGRAVRLLPGAAAASLFLVAVSILFSMFIGASTRYPLIYGSLASVILMMLWLYLCGMILFLGNALNVSLERCGAVNRPGRYE